MMIDKNSTYDSTDCSPTVDFSDSPQVPDVHRNQIRKLLNEIDIPSDAYQVEYSRSSEATQLYIFEHENDETDKSATTLDIEQFGIDEYELTYYIGSKVFMCISITSDINYE
jgi:hypothetical protein